MVGLAAVLAAPVVFLFVSINGLSDRVDRLADQVDGTANLKMHTSHAIEDWQAMQEDLEGIYRLQEAMLEKLNGSTERDAGTE